MRTFTLANTDFTRVEIDGQKRRLLTREAYQVYRRHLKPEGVLALHISNRYLDLKPVVAEGMAGMGWHGRVTEDDGILQSYYTGTTWVILAPDAQFFQTQHFQDDDGSEVRPLLPKPGFRAWTDDFSNIVSIIK